MREAAGSAATVVAGNWTNLLFWECLISGMIPRGRVGKNTNEEDDESFEAGEWRKSRESLTERSAAPRPPVKSL